MIEFRIKGKVCAKQRAKFFRNHVATPEQTVNYETLIRMTYLQHYPDREPLNTALKLTIVAFFGVTSSTSKKNKILMLIDKILPTKKPDVDNIAKIVMDALNKVAYQDDKLITDLIVKKRYNEVEALDIALEEMEV